MVVMAIDPGRDKCGIIVMSESGEIFFQSVIETVKLDTTVWELAKIFEPEIIILGDGTTSESAKNTISSKVPDIRIEVLNERHTTEEARKLYWKKNPPHGWRRLLPTSMQVPPEPVDDIVAEILAKKFLKIEV